MNQSKPLLKDDPAEYLCLGSCRVPVAVDPDNLYISDLTESHVDRSARSTRDLGARFRLCS